jgi:hypothetical protein
VDAKAEFLERALRACASVGLFTEDASGRFGLTPLSEPLTLSSPVSVKRFAELIGGPWWKTWGSLPDALKTGQPQTRAQTGKDSWDARDAPEETERFGEAMQSNLAYVPGLIEHCDFTETQTLVDVGGGFGHIAIALLRRFSHLRAVVLDLPGVIAIGEQRAARDADDVLARLSLVGGDMFDDVPAGDTLLMSRILHDWDDSSCARLLRRCRDRIGGDGRIVCIDAVLPPMGDASGSAAKLLDLLMMVTLPGKERTEAEWRSLFDSAGLEVALIALIEPRNCISVIQGVKR